MKERMANSLAGRIIIIMVVGLTFSHILSILVFTSEKLEPAVLGHEEEVLERMATLIQIFPVIPRDIRQPFLAASMRSGMNFSLIGATGPGWPLPPRDNDETLRRLLEGKIGQTGARVIAFSAGPPDWNHRLGSFHRFVFALEMKLIRWMHDAVMERELRAWIDFPTGERLLLESLLTENHVPLFRHATFSVIIMSVAILIFALIVSRATTRPLRRIVEAVDTVGQNATAAPLPETGPTEVVAVARAFNRMNRRIREFVADRLRMVAAISHDLRTPLTKLKLMVEFANDEHTRKRMVETLDEMESMLAATLTYSRDALLDEPRQRVNLTSLVGALATDMIDAGHDVVFSEEERLICHCRPMAMKRALNNLIHNAVQYGGAARITLHRKQRTAILLIHDPGEGIPEKEWDNVFKPFFRLESARGSGMGNVGLGLSIAGTVLRDHDASIRFFHPDSGGFVTRVALPIDP
ncbi:MAG: HAMP domain-containing protein [Magnetococcales bacterium]|nr:HAMP domain-containing protein [Magnetococcales bacterium]